MKKIKEGKDPLHEYKPLYRRKLPHLHDPGGTLFVTFRLIDSIPRSVVARYKNEKQIVEEEIRRFTATHAESAEIEDLRSEKLKAFHRDWFRRFEKILDKCDSGPNWLSNTSVASMIAESLLYRNGQEYDLRCFCIMSNHVHVVFRPLLDPRNVVVESQRPIKLATTDPTLASIMTSLKGFTARRANQILKRTGKFWEAESYDHQIRNSSSYFRIVNYVLQNPVKAGLVNEWKNWKWTWLADDLKPLFGDDQPDS